MGTSVGLPAPWLSPHTGRGGWGAGGAFWCPKWPVPSSRHSPPHSHLGSRGGASITVNRLSFSGVVAHHLNDFQGRLRAIISVESVYFICICAHQIGYGGQWGD
jgi:hypothetical protein